MQIQWPRAYRGDVCKAEMRREIADFKVTEVAAHSPAGVGEHLYLEIEKTDLTTREVQSLLAVHFRVKLVDVSYAGMKDKRAIARQWFSVRLPSHECTDLAHPQIRTLQVNRHKKKLRRGEMAENRFEIVLRGVQGDARAALESLARAPQPNYFGAQRFGRDYANIASAAAWIEAHRDRDRPRIARFKKSIYVSTLRSVLFNDVLGARVQAGTWCDVLPGDVVREGLPTGPLWGRGQLRSRFAIHELEREVTQTRRELREGLEWVGVTQDRRVLSVRLRNFESVFAATRSRSGSHYRRDPTRVV